MPQFLANYPPLMNVHKSVQSCENVFNVKLFPEDVVNTQINVET